MAKLARKRKALKKKERIAKIALKLKLETLKKQVAGTNLYSYFCRNEEIGQRKKE